LGGTPVTTAVGTADKTGNLAAVAGGFAIDCPGLGVITADLTGAGIGPDVILADTAVTAGRATALAGTTGFPTTLSVAAGIVPDETTRLSGGADVGAIGDGTFTLAGTGTFTPPLGAILA